MMNKIIWYGRISTQENKHH